MPVDVSKALDLKYNHNLSYEEIAAIQGVSKQAIHNRLKNLLPIPETKTFMENRGDILASFQAKMLANLDDEKINKMAGDRLVWSAAVLYDKERLERGMSTANLASVHADIAALRASEVEEEKKYP